MWQTDTNLKSNFVIRWGKLQINQCTEKYCNRCTIKWLTRWLIRWPVRWPTRYVTCITLSLFYHSINWIYVLWYISWYILLNQISVYDDGGRFTLGARTRIHESTNLVRNYCQVKHKLQAKVSLKAEFALICFDTDMWRKIMQICGCRSCSYVDVEWILLFFLGAKTL